MSPDPRDIDWLRRLPKTDIHCHLDGSLRPQTVLDLSRQYKVKLPADTLEGITPLVQVGPTCGSLREFLDVFDVIYPLLRHPAAVERIAYELVEDCALENIRHVEVRLAPELQALSSFDSEKVLEATLKGLDRGARDFGTTSSVIVCLFRAHGPAENRRAFGALKRLFRPQTKLSQPAVVGVDLAGDEARYPTIQFASFFEEAQELGIHTTCHAGETLGTANLEAALQLSVMRIGHGIHLMEDQRLLAEVVRRKVPLEVGITSNVSTKSVPNLASHPARTFHQAGVPVTLNTDDRGILGIDLTHEYGQAVALGFSLEELAGIALGSIDHLFLPAPERARLKLAFESEIATMLPRAGRALA